MRKEAEEGGATDEELLKIFDYRDFIHFFVIIFCRMMVIGVKYGFYSDAHEKIIGSVRLSNEFRSKSLLVASLLNRDIEPILDRIEDSMIALEIIEESFFVQCNKNQCQFRIIDYQRTRRRLLDLNVMKKELPNMNDEFYLT